MDHAFICYARSDAAFVLTLTSGLRARGRPVWVDSEDIAPGVNWDAAIDAAIEGCAAFLIVLSPDAVSSGEVRGELRAALNQGKRVVPILYRPCDVPRQLQSTQYLDVSATGAITEEELDRLARALQEPPQGVVSPPLPDRAREDRNRRAVLDDVRREVTDRLARSLHTDVPVPLLMEMQPHQVARPWDREVKASAIPEVTPAVTGILDVFCDEAVAGRLLILGAPGSGKTIASLQLARELTARAEHDPREPIPVLLSLSSWKDRDGELGRWLPGELKTKYGIHPDQSSAWLDAGRLALLLDGLDELPAERHEACVEAVNDFLQAYRPRQLVVCCRLAEYENLAVKLQLSGAVRLLPMTAAQIEDYLRRAGRSRFWEEVRADPEAMELAGSPLLLGVMASVGEGLGTAVWKETDSSSQRRARLFDAYVRLYMAERPGDVYPSERAQEWLAGLADILRRQGQSEFLVERMQPGWLGPGRQLWLYRVGVFLATAVAVVAVMAATSLVTGLVPPGAITSAALRAVPILADDDILAIAVALALGAVVAARNTITPIETLTFSWARTRTSAVRWMRKALEAGPQWGIYLGIAIGLWLVVYRDVGTTVANTASSWKTAGVLMGVAGGILGAVALALIQPGLWTSAARRPRVRPRLAAVAVTGLAPGLLLGITMDWTWGLLWAAMITLLVGLGTTWDDRSRIRLLRTLTATAAASMVFGAASLGAARVETPYTTWVAVWLMGGLAAGLIAALIHAFATRLRGKTGSAGGHEPLGTARSWVSLLAVSASAGLALGLACGALARAGFDAAVREAAAAGLYLHVQLVQTTVFAAWGAIVTAIAALAAVPVAGLWGALSGITGPDVVRRAVPNQGIHQSASNVLVFWLLGALMIGLPYGLFNLALGAMVTGVRPSAADWWRIALGGGLLFALLAGLLPGAACIQHYVLRFVLWASGTVPFRVPRFLDFASDRMLLQRVGGRYRFIHVLLRDHLARRHAA
jgi:hypothetical protein